VTKKQLLKELAEDTYAALKPSPVHGIGVFAIRDIPKGCRSVFSKPNKHWIKLSKKKISRLPAHSIELIETYCLSDEKNYYVPDFGFKIVDLVIFLNHSDDTPNLVSVDEGNYYEALRDIAAGEELLISYP
jgi:SET domain-containing protein